MRRLWSTREGERVRRRQRMIVRAFLKFSFVKRVRNRGHTLITRAELELGIPVFEMLKSQLDHALVVFGTYNYVISYDSCQTLQYVCIKKWNSTLPPAADQGLYRLDGKFIWTHALTEFIGPHGLVWQLIRMQMASSHHCNWLRTLSLTAHSVTLFHAVCPCSFPATRLHGIAVLRTWSNRMRSRMVYYALLTCFVMKTH
jgi:hypothetical protein